MRQTFFRVSAWRELGENCAKYLEKGKKVCVVGSVSMSTFTAQDGKTYSNLEVNAHEVEFLTPRSAVEQAAPAQAPVIDEQSGMEKVDPPELPF